MGSLCDPGPAGPIYLLFSDAYQWTAWVIPPQIPLSNINNISGSVRSSKLSKPIRGPLEMRWIKRIVFQARISKGFKNVC